MAWFKILFKSTGFLSQVADALINPEEAGYGSDIVRAVDESIGDAGFLRKVVLPFSRTSYTALADDQATISFMLAKNTADAPDSNWITADFTAAEARLNTWYTAVKPYMSPNQSLVSYRWYKAGPAFPLSGPPVRITSRNLVGTGTGNQLPPQVALNVSEHTRLRKHWGRFYLPTITDAANDGYGRINASARTAIHTATVAMYNGWRADGVTPVIYSIAKPSRKTKKGVTLPAQPARAYAIEELKTDDIFDVIRSRRWNVPNAVSSTVLT